jgi:hypothetical protein
LRLVCYANPAPHRNMRVCWWPHFGAHTPHARVGPASLGAGCQTHAPGPRRHIYYNLSVPSEAHPPLAPLSGIGGEVAIKFEEHGGGSAYLICAWRVRCASGVVFPQRRLTSAHLLRRPARQSEPSSHGLAARVVVYGQACVFSRGRLPGARVRSPPEVCSAKPTQHPRPCGPGGGRWAGLCHMALKCYVGDTQLQQGF